MTITPTEEQEQALSHFLTGEDLRLDAYAGSAKTTTLELSARSTNRRGAYLAFNKSIAQEAARKFPSNVLCQTTHSLAFRALAPRYSGVSNKLTGRLNANAIARLLDLGPLRISKECGFSACSLAALVQETLRRFLMSAALEISHPHVPHNGSMSLLNDEDLATLRAHAAKLATMLWDRMKDPADPTSLGHDGYLKLWALTQPRLPAEFILLDEAQDTNEVVLDLLHRQSAQVVYVGDRYQQIYEWRGAINAMEKIDVDRVAHLTRSFRFGERIAGIASRVLKLLGETKPLRGLSSANGQVLLEGAAPVVLCRTNAMVMSETLFALGAGRTPFVVGGTGELIRMLESVALLKLGIPSDLPEFFGFQTWKELVDFSESEEDQSLRTFTRLVQTHGEQTLLAALKRSAQKEEDADLIVSTAHRAKGREWPSVRLADDFPLTVTRKTLGKGDSKTELRLLYVAITRPRERLVLPFGLWSFLDLDALRKDEIKEASCLADSPKPPSPPTPRPSAQFQPLDANTADLPSPDPAPSEAASPRHQEGKSISSPLRMPVQDTGSGEWYCSSVSDLGSPQALCENCRKETVRYLHTVCHRTTGETRNVGCICAGHFCGDVAEARSREAKFKSYLKRKQRWLTRKWRVSAKGNQYLNIRTQNLVVFPQRSGLWNFKIDGSFGPGGFDSSMSAKAGMFEVWFAAAKPPVGRCPTGKRAKPGPSEVVAFLKREVPG